VDVFNVFPEAVVSASEMAWSWARAKGTRKVRRRVDGRIVVDWYF
jgi:hypothetical protein